MKKTISILVLVFILAGNINAQFSISNADRIASIKNGTTYVVMHDTASDIAQKYKAIYRKYWTLSKVAFITYADIDKNIKPGASFITVDVVAIMVQSSNDMAANQANLGGQLGGNNLRNMGTETHVYLSLWVPEEKFFKKDKKEFKDSYKDVVAQISLFPDHYMSAKEMYKYNSDNNNHYKYEYETNVYSADGPAHIYNWGLGFAKNYIQLMISYMNDGKNRGFYKGIEDDNAMKGLAKSTLYIPDYVLINFKQSKGEDNTFDEKDMMKDYKHKYSIVKNEELNNMILDDSKGIFYLVFFKSSSDKWVTVFDSQSGEIVYSSYSPMAYNMKPKDMKSLYEAGR